MSNKYIELGTSRRDLVKKLKRLSGNEAKGRMIAEALAHLDAQEAAAPEPAPVIEVAPEPEPMPEPVVEAIAEEAAVKPKRTYRRRKTTKAKSEE